MCVCVCVCVDNEKNGGSHSVTWRSAYTRGVSLYIYEHIHTTRVMVFKGDTLYIYMGLECYQYGIIIYPWAN